MKMNNENDIKELNFGGAEESAPVSSSEETVPTPSTDSQPEPQGPRKLSDHQNGAGGNGNSFYERQQNNSTSDTKWYKDWRGKTLGLTIAALLLIGGGIPAGMAMAGYFNHNDFDGLKENSDVETAFDLAEDEVNRIYNQAILERYDGLVAEGYITQRAHDKKLEDSEESATDIIDGEKESLKDQYGNTWEEEWDNELKEKGFHTSANGGEEEYKDSMIVSDVEGDVKTQFNTKSALTSVNTEDAGYDFISTEANTKGKYYYVENLVPSIASGEQTWESIGNYSYTPEDLMNLFVLTYQPIVFNNSLLPFIPVLGATGTEANIQGDNVYMTNSDIKNAWSFAKVDTLGTKEVAAENFGGIKQKYNVSFTSESLGEEADIAVNLALAGKIDGTATVSITSIVDAGFAAANASNTDIPATASEATSSDIDNMTSNDITEFQKGMGKALQDAGLLTKTGLAGATTLRSFATTGYATETGTVAFVSTNGLNNIGVSFEGSEVVVEQLDFYAGVRNAIDLSLISTFNTWFESAFKYITIIDYFTNPISSNDGWFDATGSLQIESNGKFVEEVGITIDSIDADNGITQEAIQSNFGLSLFQPVVLNTLNANASAYTDGETFVNTNWQDYDADSWSTGAGADILAYVSGSTLSTFTDNYLVEVLELGAAKAEAKNEIILNRGGKQ